MAARAALHSLIALDPKLGDDPEGIGVQNVYAANSVDTPPESLFIIIKWEPSELAFKSVGYDRVSIWVHDTNRDYGRINEVLRRLKELLPDTVHREGEDGWTLTTAEWRSEGPDLFDSGYNTVTRYTEFTVISRYSSS